MVCGWRSSACFGSIFVDSNEAQNSISKTEQKAEGLGSKLGSMGKTAAKAGLAIGAGMVTAGAAVFGLANNAAQAGDRVDKMSQKLGMSRQGFQEWDFILSQNGTSIESMNAGMKRLTNTLDDAKNGGEGALDAFERIGLSLDDISDMTQEQLFEAVVTQLQGMEDGAEKAAIANQLLGNSGKELMPLLNGAAGSVDELRQKANELGLVMSDEAIDGAVAFADTMDQLKRTVGATINQAIGPMMPMINDLAQELLKIIPPLLGFIQPLMEKLMPVVQRLIDTLLPLFIRLLDAFMPVLDPLIDIFVMLLDAAFLPIIDALVQIAEAILPVFIQMLEAIMPAVEPVLKIFTELLQGILPVLISLFGQVSETVLPLLTKAFQDLQPVIDGFKKIAGGLIDFITGVFTGDWRKAWDGVGKIFSGVWDSLQGIAKGTLNGVIRAVNAMIRGINRLKFNVPDWVPVIGGKKWGLDIPQIPMLAKGGDVVEQGAAIVGERGPELLELPKGARVTPLKQTTEQNVNHSGIITVKGVNDRNQTMAVVEIIMDQLRREVRTA